MKVFKIAMVAGLAALSFNIYATSADARRGAGRGSVVIGSTGYQSYIARRYYRPNTITPNAPPSEVLPQPPINRASPRANSIHPGEMFQPMR